MTGPTATGRAAPQVLAGSRQRLSLRYDVALLDLDGVVYLGADPVPAAADALTAARLAGMRLVFVTNNASRTPEQVAAQLSRLGVPATPDEVVTSAQAAARLLAERFQPGTPVLLTGGEGLHAALTEVGLVPVGSAEDHPAAVAQGFSPTLSYADLVEAAVAVRRGAVWVAANRDSTLPSPRGPVPGTGALVAVVSTASGAEPTYAGKPEPALHLESIRRSGARCPLVVGDRLDTDIEGAVRGGTDSLLVLTGVTGPRDLLAAEPARRPSYLAADLHGLLIAHPPVRLDGSGGSCRGWLVRRSDRTLWLVDPSPEPSVRPAHQAAPDSPDVSDELDGLRALCAVSWAAADAGSTVHQAEADGPRSAELLTRWGLSAGW